MVGISGRPSSTAGLGEVAAEEVAQSADEPATEATSKDRRSSNTVRAAPRGFIATIGTQDVEEGMYRRALGKAAVIKIN